MNAPTPARRPRRKPANRYHHGDLRRALCEAGWTLVERRGVDALSLRALAEALGVSHAAPTHHFRDKEDLLDALRLMAWSRFADALAQADSGVPLPLRRMADAYVEFALAHPKVLQLMFRAGPRPPAAAVMEQSQRAWQALVQAVAAHIGPERAARLPELKTLAVAAWAQVHGLALLWTWPWLQTRVKEPRLADWGPEAAA